MKAAEVQRLEQYRGLLQSDYDTQVAKAAQLKEAIETRCEAIMKWAALLVAFAWRQNKAILTDTRNLDSKSLFFLRRVYLKFTENCASELFPRNTLILLIVTTHADHL